MTSKIDAQQAIKRFSDRHQARLEYKVAYAGDGNGNVYTSQANYYLVRYPLASSPPMEIFNNRINLVDNLRVIIGYTPYQPNLLQVLDVADQRLDSQGAGDTPVGPGGPGYSTVPPHAVNHQYLGSDVINVNWRQVTALGVFPTSPPSLSVTIWPGTIPRSGTDINVPYTTLDLTSHVPVSGALYALISFNSSGTPVVTDGSINAGGFAALGNSDVPDTPAGNWRSCVVALYVGQTAIVETTSENDFIDLRFPEERPAISSTTPHWHNVIDYGATGDGSTDDTTAINAALTAISSNGGVLYFPGGYNFKITSGLTLAKPITVRGDGSADAYNSTSDAISLITFTSTTGTLFNFTSQGCSIQDVALVCSGTATAGSGITASGGNFSVERVRIQGFYDNLVLTGEYFKVHACYILGPRRYGIVANNTAFSGDFGDWTISDTIIGTLGYNATSAIYNPAGGGGKIVNCKTNGYPGGYGFQHPISVAIGSGIVTSIFLIENCSIENYSGNGINIATSGTSPFFGLIKISGCEFGCYSTANSGGNGINISAANLGEIEQVIIDDCNFRASTGGSVSMAEAISLTKIDNIYLGLYTINANWTGYLVQSGCTNLKQIGTGTVTSVGTGTGLTGGTITTSGTIDLADTAVTPGAYTLANITVDQQGRITAASSNLTAGQVLMADGITPPDPLLTEDETDWLYEG